MLKGKKIVLGITGSIAAYKSCLIIRELIKRGAEVQVVITPDGKEFITPITLSALTHKPVIMNSSHNVTAHGIHMLTLVYGLTQ
jgi:Phosphopantothenoylcysteine synthetase/decarboxylase